MAGALVVVLVRYAAGTPVPLRAHPGRVLAAARGGVPLLVRTLALRAVLLVTTWVAAGLGDVPLAAYQVTATIWTFLAFALDALAIAAQAITGKALGAGEVDRTRDATTLVVRWGVSSGVVLGVLLLLLRTVLGPLFTPDPAVQAAIAGGLVVVALGQPLSGFVFVVDGVLIGAGDGPWLARAHARPRCWPTCPSSSGCTSPATGCSRAAAPAATSTPSSGCGSPSPPSCRCAAP